MITEKENLLLVMKGEQPEWVPITMYQPGVTSGRKESLHIVVPPLMEGFVSGINGGKGSVDIWGVQYVPSEEAGGGYIHKPGVHVLPLDDFEHWHDYLHAPDFSNVDWETLIKEQMKTIDRNETAIQLLLNPGYFITLVGLMGFQEALIAFGEYPEEMEALLDYLSDFYTEIIEKLIPIYKPEFIGIGEDNVSSAAPLMSLETFRHTLLKANKKHMRMAKEMGIYVGMHCCGKGEFFLEDWMDAGINMWECAFPFNDLAGIKKQYGNKLVINGGWDPTTNLTDVLNPSDEEIIQSVKDAIDLYAPGGGYVFNGYFLGRLGDPETLRKNNLLVKTAEEYGMTVYK